MINFYGTARKKIASLPDWLIVLVGTLALAPIALISAMGILAYVLSESAH